MQTLEIIIFLQLKLSCVKGQVTDISG